MTQIGHTLVGAAIGITSLPNRDTTKRKVAHVAAFIFLANIPDLPLENWGHDRYDISHSLFVTLSIFGMAVLLFALLRNMRGKIDGWPVIAGGIIAWLSHLLLDSFYNHGKGVAIFWPFSDVRLVLPIPWFSTVKDLTPPMTPELAKILLIEFMCYFPFVVLAILIRKLKTRSPQFFKTEA